MSITVAILLSILGLIFFGWGFAITFVDRFYVWWRDRYWKEQNGKHLTFDRELRSRYIDGIGAIIFGLVAFYIIFSNVRL